jgi:hypothetical protein
MAALFLPHCCSYYMFVLYILVSRLGVLYICKLFQYTSSGKDVKLTDRLH